MNAETALRKCFSSLKILSDAKSVDIEYCTNQEPGELFNMKLDSPPLVNPLIKQSNQSCSSMRQVETNDFCCRL